jgi:hypothetical protein
MKKVFWLIVAAISLATLFTSAIAQPASLLPEQKPAQQLSRKVEGPVLTSTETPAVKIEFDKAFKYAGGHDFILYQVARAE